MTALDETFNNFEIYANQIGYKKLTKTELFKFFVASRNDEYLENCYFAGVMCKYWYMAGMLWDKWKQFDLSTLEDMGDMIGWLSDAIWEARDKYEKFGDAKCSCETIINRCINQQLWHHCEYYQLDKNKANAYLQSINASEDEFGDASESIKELAINPLKYEYTSNCHLIHYFLDKKDYAKAIIIDLITNYDVLKDTCGEVKNSKVVKSLQSLDEDYRNRFNRIYRNDITSYILKLQECRVNDLKELVELELNELRNDSEVLSELK